MDHGRKSVLRDKRRREDVRNAAEANGSTIEALAPTARRDGARHRRRLELPLAVHTSVVKSGKLGHALSWWRDILANERTLSVGYLCAALNIDLGNKARLVARVEYLE